MPSSKRVEAFDKYEYYLRSVQSPDTDCDFISKTYRDFNNREPVLLREDFCAAFALCCEWVKSKPKRAAIALDLDPEPLSYGQKHYAAKLTSTQRQRLQIIKRDVLSPPLPPADVVAAFNFSFFCFKERRQLLKYFVNCHKSLRPGGLMLLDCFGGPECHSPNEQETVHRNYSYFWDQDSYNPITHEALFYIHFKRKGEKKREKVFTYDWRMWTIPELTDLLKEAGFSKTVVYWEGTDRNGEGNGIYKPSRTGEICDSWVAYIAAQK